MSVICALFLWNEFLGAHFMAAMTEPGAQHKLRHHIGIRGKLLAFLAIAVLFIVALEIIAQNATYTAAEEYEQDLAHYHLVHRLRVTLDNLRQNSDRFIKDPNVVSIENLYESIATLNSLSTSLAPLEELSIEAGFEVRAVGYGFDAYLPVLSRSLSARASGKSDYYADFARADRIAGYIDTYLSRLLGILLRDGEARFKIISSRMKEINKIILIGIVVAGLLSLGYVFLIANSITKPIRRLAAASEKLARGELEIDPLPRKSHDEVGVLADSFFIMSQNIRFSIENLQEKAELEKKLHEEELTLLSMGKALREAQFMNLQDQMRPHFLFNALNSIARTALLEKAKATERLAISLSKLLRSTIKEGGPYIPLIEEVDIVQEYLAFQKARFGDRFEWHIIFDPELKAFRIPRFLLQPLVENAIRHGVEPKEEKTEILVSIRRRGERLRIAVADTGTGMAAARLADLRLRLHQPYETMPASAKSENLVNGNGIGLVNVSNRLMILYGQEATMKLYSIEGKGTIVRLSIPLKGISRWPESL